jgi:predicted ATPase/class 3 adenylate cyclase
VNVATWLRQLGLERYEQAFRDNAIDVEILPELTDADLEKLGVLLGHRKKLLKAIAALRTDEASSASLLQAGSSVPPEARRTAGAERRQLTVMFVDLVGSTALSAKLDPEEMGQVIRGYQHTCAEVVQRWDGNVAKYMGDGVLVYFGWPRAHEDDAERAVRAGLELVAAVGRLVTPTDETLAARVGIATGLVMVGDLIGEGAAREEAVVGETPNLAARLQGLAGSGAVVIAQRTRQLLGDLFDFEEVGTHYLKGIAARVQAWRVLAEGHAESRFEALHGGQLAAIIGREHELGVLVDCWERAKKGGGQVVLLGGEPGIGKSRIARALRERLDHEYLIPLSHHCSPYHTNTALHPVIGMLERAAGFARDDRAEGRLDKLEALLARDTEALGEAVPLVAALLGIETGERYPPLALSPQRQKQRTLEVLVDQVEGLAARRPVLAVYEDVHWADPTTRELLGLLIERVRRLPALVLITFRPEFEPPWTGEGHVTQLRLNRLGRREGAALVGRITGGKGLPNNVLEQILSKTDGVPLFVEELTKTVLESALLTDAGDHYALAGPLPPLAIPTTLHDSLMARLDHLAPIKEVAQIGAVIGREFAHELIAAVSPLPEATLGDALDQLVNAELIFRGGAPPDVTYSFKHALLRDAAYESLLKSRRQELHSKLADVLDQRFPEVVESQPELLARHLTEAGRLGAAVPHWQRAGERANDRSANTEAQSHLSKALDLIRTLPAGLERQRREISALTVLGRVLTAKSGYGNPEVERVYAEARHLCDAMPEDVNVFPVLLGLAIYSAVRAEFEAGLELSDRLLELARQSNEPTWMVEAHYARGITDAWRGDFKDAHRHLELACNIYRPERHHAHLALYGQDPGPICLCRWSAVLWALGYPGQSLTRMEEALALIEQLAHPFSSAYVLTWSAWLMIFRRELDEAAVRNDHALKFATEQAYPFWAAMAIEQEGWLLSQQGRKEQAIARLEEGLARMQAIGTQATAAYTMGLLGEALANLGRAANGVRLIDQALSRVNQSQERWCDAELLRLRGVALLAGDPPDRAAAEISFGQAINRSREQAAKSWELRAAISLARLWAEQGERQKAYDLLAPVYGWFTEGFDTQDLKDANALLNQLT